jgi:hypothetical protein
MQEMSILNDKMELLATVKENKAILKAKAKTTEKTFRNSSKNPHADKSAKY